MDDEQWVQKLWDISIRNINNGIWEGWKNLIFLENLQRQYNMLQCLLVGATPVSNSKKGQRCWGSKGEYYAALGYSTLASQDGSPPQSSMWKNLWDFVSPSKINILN